MRRIRHPANRLCPLVVMSAIALMGGAGFTPAFGAGGNVAWESQRNGNQEIYVAPADGTGAPINVSRNGADDVKPSLSADGGTVAWTSYRDDNAEIYVAAADGSGVPRNISTNRAGDVDASLSANGGMVAWTSNRDGNDEIYVARADGTGAPINVSKSKGEDAELEAAIREIPGDVLVVLNASAADNRESVPGHPGAPWTQAPADVDQWAAWARSVMERLIPLGVTNYQIWNEPNQDIFFNSTGDNLTKYLTLLEAVGAVRPEGVTLYSAGIANENDPRSWSTRIAEDQGVAFDVLAIHPYHYSNPAATLESTVTSMLPDGFAGPYAVTEYGTPNEADHATFLANARAFQDAQGVAFFYYTLTPDDGGGTYALYPSEPDQEPQARSQASAVFPDSSDSYGSARLTQEDTRRASWTPATHAYGERMDPGTTEASGATTSSLGFGAANGFDYPDAYERSLLVEGGFEAVRFDVSPGLELAEPSLSADGSTVAWTSNRDGNPEIYIAPTDGGGTPTNVSMNGFPDFSPSISADGRTVAWGSHLGSNQEIYVTSSDGSGTPTNVSRDDGDDYFPSLTADGGTVAWASDRDGNAEIYVTSADGTGTPVNVSRSDRGDSDPSLSANGGTVAWRSDRDGSPEIYVAASNGSGTPVNVSTDAEEDSWPSLAATSYTAASSIADGDAVAEPLSWEIQVTTIGAVDRVEFVVDGTPVLIDAAAPYVFPLDPAAYPNGPLTLEARVFATPSAAGPVASVPLTVTISNPSPLATTAPAPTPIAPSPVCASVPAPTPSTAGTVELSAAQVRVNQRIYSAGIRRAAAIERWLADGIVTNDLCAGGISAARFGEGITIGPGPGGEIGGAAPTPRPIIQRPPATKRNVSFTLSAPQLQVNQRIASALVRRANALRDRLAAGLTGGDVRNGQIDATKLSPAIAITGATPGPNPPGPTVTKVAPPTTKTDVTFTLSTQQLQINQRIGSAAIRRLNAVRDRLLTGLADDDFRANSITALDLAPGAAP